MLSKYAHFVQVEGKTFSPAEAKMPKTAKNIALRYVNIRAFFVHIIKNKSTILYNLEQEYLGLKNTHKTTKKDHF